MSTGSPVGEVLAALLEDARTRRAEAEQALQDRETEVRGLELALAHATGVPVSRTSDVVTPVVTSPPASSVTRTEAIIRVLTEAGGTPVLTGEITRRLRAMGRNDASNHVHATLYSLQKRGRIRTSGRMKGWTLSEEEAPDPAASPAPTEAADRGGYAVTGDPAPPAADKRPDPLIRVEPAPPPDNRPGPVIAADPAQPGADNRPDPLIGVEPAPPGADNRPGPVMERGVAVSE